VGGLERAGGLTQPAQRRRVGDRAPGPQPLGDGAAAHQRHHDERAAVVLADVVDRHHVLVPGEPRGGARLALEAPPGAAVLGQVRAEHLDRDQAVEQLVVGLPHSGHPAAGEVAYDAIALGQGDALRADRRH
jgi:hypothetical protein